MENGIEPEKVSVLPNAVDPERFDIAPRDEELEDELAASLAPFPRAESYAFHELIDPRETRPMLCEWIDLIRPLLPQLLGPRHFGIRP